MKNGSLYWEKLVNKLHQSGFVRQFALTYTDDYPATIQIDKNDNGWVICQKIKTYCLEQKN